jgi:predicted metal-binding membrane protein
MSTYSGPRRPSFRLAPTTLVLLFLAAALVTWIVAVQRMRGMDAGPGTDLGGLGWYVGIWVTMMAAMMFPSAAPMVLLFQRVSSEQAKRGQTFVPTWVFAFSYFAVWTVYGLAAYGLYRLVVHFDFGFLAWDRGGPYVAGSAIGAAGLYELTPLKSVCLRHCRTPLHFVMGHWRPGRLGAILMGAEHGAYCVGCCWGLMIVLFALGVMSLTWMAVVAVLILAQKVLPYGDYLTRVFAVAFVAGGIWVAAAPGSVPGLTLPNSDAADRARMRMMHMTPGEQMKPATKPGTDMAPMQPGG